MVPQLHLQSVTLQIMKAQLIIISSKIKVKTWRSIKRYWIDTRISSTVLINGLTCNTTKYQLVQFVKARSVIQMESLVFLKAY